MDPFFLATSRFNRQKYDDCIDICTQMLDKNPYDQAAWLLKCKALTKKSWVDDLEIDEEGVADILMGKRPSKSKNHFCPQIRPSIMILYAHYFIPYVQMKMQLLLLQGLAHPFLALSVAQGSLEGFLKI